MLTLRTFGALGLSGPDGEEITAILSQPKRFALLVYLVLARPGDLHRRDTLLSMFWPERDDVRARNALSQSLSYLRRNLPSGVILKRGMEEVGVDPALIGADVLGFETAIAAGQWREALDFYGGEFLRGFHLGGAWDFEDWVEGERVRLRELAAGAAWSLAQEQIEAGALVEAERTAQKALDLVWADESPVRAFIEALAKAGDGASALNLYERFCRKLREELEVEPSQPTREVAEAVRNGEMTGPLPPPPQEAPTPPADPGPDEPPSALPGKPGRLARLGRFGAWAVGASITLLGAVAGYSALTRDPGPDFISDLVVVPPFENRTGDPELDEVAVLAAVWVEEAIQQVGGVQVVPSSFARQYSEEARMNGSPNPAEAVAERSKAGWVVGGVISDLGDSLEFRAEVIDVSHHRKEQDVVERGFRDALSDVIDRVAQRVSGALAYEFDPWMGESEVGSQPLPSPPTLEAFREHRLGYEAYYIPDRAASFQHHMAAFELDTTLVRAVVAAAFMTDDYLLADSLAQFANQRRHRLSRQGQLDLDVLLALRAKDMEGALRAMWKLARLEGGGFSSVLVSWFAIRLNRPGEALAATERYDPTLEWRRNEAHDYWFYRTEALHMLGEFEKELVEARRGRETYPSRPGLLNSEVRALAALGRVDEVSGLLHQARGLSNERFRAALVAGAELREHGFVNESKDAFNRATEWLTTGPPAEEWIQPEGLHLAEALYGAERWVEAHAVVKRLLEESSEDLSALGMVGLTAARSGDSVRASEVIDRLSDMNPPYAAGENLYLMASISAVLGRPDEAMSVLYRAFEEGFPHGLRLHSDMNFESLRERDDFRALVRPKG